MMATKGPLLQRITNVEFPRDLPSDFEKNFIVVVCDSDAIQWTFHEGIKHRYSPSVFWTTPHLREEDVCPTSCLTLHRYLCHHVLNFIFGGNDVKCATKQSASRVAAKRKIPFTTVYILSDSQDHENTILQLFEDVPSRFFRLRPTDFFTSKQIGDLSESMISVAHHAAIYAAKNEHGLPLLLLKGGNSAIMYTGIDRESKFLGGGACPGMSIRCRNLSDYCSKDFPTIDFEKYKQITDRVRERERPMSLFESDTEDSIVANATAELAGQLRNIVNQFLKLVGPSENAATVVVTGDDTETMLQLLKENCSGIIETEPDVVFPSSKQIKICSEKNLASYGVRHLLKLYKKKVVPRDSNDEMRENFIGLRVAIKNPNKNIVRGSVSRVVPGKILEEDTFVVSLDDGEKAFLEFTKIYDVMLLYREVGEETIEENKEDWVREKREASAKVQVSLEVSNDKIKKRKIELDEANIKDGSILNTVFPEKEQSKVAKRPKSTPKKKEIVPAKYIGQRIAKYFDNSTEEDPDDQILYFGTIDRYSVDSKLWHITYDDDDEEEFDFSELRQSILLHSKNRDDDTNGVSG